MQFHIFSATAAPRVQLANLTAFVRTDFSFDIPAIKAVAKFRYDAKLAFINGYTGPAKRFWQRSIARRVIAVAWREAREQRHNLVWAELPYNLPFTRAERDRREHLRVIITSAPITAHGNADHRAAAAEFGAIGATAQRRAYDAIITKHQGGSS